MTIRDHSRGLLVPLLSAVLLSACGSSNGTGTAPTVSTALGIAAVSPSVTVISTTPQTITVTGFSFSSTLLLTVVQPDGNLIQFSPAQLSALTSTRFDVPILLNETGAYQLTVKNPTGETASSSITVQTEVKAPVIVGILPIVPSKNAAFQSVLVQGIGFADGLSVSLIDPAGVFIASSVSSVQPTQLQLSAVFAKSGVYQLTVMNPTGESSNTFTFSVQ